MRRGRKAPFSCDPDAMPEPIARLYLATPPIADAEAFAPRLAEACAAGEVAAVLLRLEGADERTLVKRVKALAPAAPEAGRPPGGRRGRAPPSSSRRRARSTSRRSRREAARMGSMSRPVRHWRDPCAN